MRICHIARPLLIMSLFCGLLLLSIPSLSQTRITSPYSYFGVGELRFNQNFQNMGMGGLGVGFRSNTSLNDVNPASYAAIDTMSFVFEATLFSHFYEQSNEEISQMGNYTALGNLAFGLPITRRLSVGFGLKPFSAMGYKIKDQAVSDDFGAMNFLYEGRGGISQAFVGASLKLYKGLSLGMNASYLFGTLERHTTSSSDTAQVFLSNRVLSNHISGWHFGMGTQYHHRLSSSSSVTLGLIYGMEQELPVSRKEVVRQALPGQIRYDTLRVLPVAEGTMAMPSYFGGGVFARFNNQWSAGIDYQQQQWANYRMLDTPGDLNNSYQLAAGVRYNPNIQTFSGPFSRIEYRAGLRYGQTFLNPNGHAIDEFGIGFGLGIPLRRSLSGVNIGFEMTSRGTTDHNLIKENFYRINVGVNVYERWFLRRRFF